MKKIYLLLLIILMLVGCETSDNARYLPTLAPTHQPLFNRTSRFRYKPKAPANAQPPSRHAEVGR